jgi:hypothetical protein
MPIQRTFCRGEGRAGAASAQRYRVQRPGAARSAAARGSAAQSRPRESSPAARADDRIDARPGNSPRTLFSNEHLPHRGIKRSDCRLDRDLHLIGRSRGSAGAGIDRAVSNQEQGTSRSNAVRHPPHHLLHGVRRVDIQADNEIVASWLCRPRRKVRLDPVDALCDIRSGGLGHRPPVRQRRRGEVHSCDPPAMRGEPEGVCAMATACVERTPRPQFGSLGRQVRVWWTACDVVGLFANRPRPQLLPEILIEPWSGHDENVPGRRTTGA